MAPKPVWVTLEPAAWVPGSFKKKVLGAVVKSYYSPIENRKPDDPTIYIQHDVVESCFDDYIHQKARVEAGHVDISLTRIFGANVDNAATESINLSSTRIQIERLQQHGDYWANLIRDETVREALANWTRTSDSVSLVVGLAICIGAGFQQESSQTEGQAIIGEVPMEAIGAAVSLPPPVASTLTSGVMASREKSTRAASRGETQDPKIFAVQVKLIKKPRWPGWLGFRLTDKGPIMMSFRPSSTKDDEDEDVGVEDLVLYGREEPWERRGGAMKC